LIRELSENAKGAIDPLIEIIDGRGGTATLDEILIDLYRKFKKVGKRMVVAKRLLFLSRRGLCWPVPGAKDYFTTIEPDQVGVSNKGNCFQKDKAPTGKHLRLLMKRER
jgi:hypothetical protein